MIESIDPMYMILIRTSRFEFKRVSTTRYFVIKFPVARQSKSLSLIVRNKNHKKKIAVQSHVNDDINYRKKLSYEPIDWTADR